METKPTKRITEFRLYPSTEQATKIDLWLTQLKWVWNTGLSLLEEDQQRYWRTKQEWVEYSPETWQWRKSCTIDKKHTDTPPSSVSSDLSRGERGIYSPTFGSLSIQSSIS